MTWRERVAAAKERGQFTEADRRDARFWWTTCAVGEQHQMFPHVVVFWGPRDEPVDEELYVYGDKFGRAVLADWFADADTLLDSIEDRVLELKRTHPGLTE